MCFLDCTVLHDQSVSLGAVTPEDGSAIEREVERFGEAEAGISQEANLKDINTMDRMSLHAQEKSFG
jgi:hypothetical protein